MDQVLIEPMKAAVNVLLMDNYMCACKYMVCMNVLPVVSTRCSLVECKGDGYIIEKVLVVARLEQLLR